MLLSPNRPKKIIPLTFTSLFVCLFLLSLQLLLLSCFNFNFNLLYAQEHQVDIGTLVPQDFIKKMIPAEISEEEQEQWEEAIRQLGDIDFKIAFDSISVRQENARKFIRISPLRISLLPHGPLGEISTLRFVTGNNYQFELSFNIDQFNIILPASGHPSFRVITQQRNKQQDERKIFFTADFKQWLITNAIPQMLQQIYSRDHQQILSLVVTPELVPPPIPEVTKPYWTPEGIAQRAAKKLAEAQAKIINDAKTKIEETKEAQGQAIWNMLAQTGRQMEERPSIYNSLVDSLEKKFQEKLDLLKNNFGLERRIEGQNKNIRIRYRDLKVPLSIKLYNGQWNIDTFLGLLTPPIIYQFGEKLDATYDQGIIRFFLKELPGPNRDISLINLLPEVDRASFLIDIENDRQTLSSVAVGKINDNTNLRVQMPSITLESLWLYVGSRYDRLGPFETNFYIKTGLDILLEELPETPEGSNSDSWLISPKTTTYQVAFPQEVLDNTPGAKSAEKIAKAIVGITKKGSGVIDWIAGFFSDEPQFTLAQIESVINQALIKLAKIYVSPNTQIEAFSDGTNDVLESLWLKFMRDNSLRFIFSEDDPGQIESIELLVPVRIPVFERIK